MKFKEGDKVKVINKRGASGSLNSLLQAAILPYGSFYIVFSVQKDKILLVGLGGIEFYPSDFKRQFGNMAKIYLYENDQRELRIEIIPEEAIDYDFNPPYEVSQDLVDRYNKVMLEYNAMQEELRKIRGE